MLVRALVFVHNKTMCVRMCVLVCVSSVSVCE